ncbi:MAG TPA: cytochrome c [Rhizomicrobium sp.]|jgi:mono/diheme cytochrome c family protein|nr:cytochrome c [Rhizomicrobium sp.]
MRAAGAILMLLMLTGCDESMDKQNRLKTYGEAHLANWPGQGEALPLPAGTVAQGDLERERETAKPPLVSLALLQRGRERYDIYCSACHGLTGAGNGIVVARGFPKPRPFDDPRLMDASAKHFVDVIGRGYGTMYSFSDRVDPKDRWAIAAYIRALQMADNNAAGPK